MIQEENLFKEAKRIYKTANADQRYVLESLFPELKESRDERIRKWLIELVEEVRKANPINESHNGNCSDAIAWLEKQGEHANFRNKIQIGDKVTRNKDGVLVNLSQLKRVAKKDEKQGEQKPAAKYKIGDTVYYNSFGRLVSFVIANIVEDGTDNPMYEDKDGNSVFQNDIVKQKPADKVEPKFKHGDRVRNKKSGLEQILGSCIEDVYEGAFPFRIKDQDDWELVEQKPAWSEEDEEIISQLAAICHVNAHASCAKFIDWLKSIKDRVQSRQEWKQENIDDLTDFENVMMHIGDSFFGENAGLDPNDTIAIKEQATILLGLVPKQGWSEEDIEMINWLIRCCEKEHEELCNDRYGHQEIVSDLKRDCRKKWDWLESLKNKVVSQNRWKPSDKQMKAIEHICDGDYKVDLDILDSIYRDFKKLLREE